MLLNQFLNSLNSGKLINIIEPDSRYMIASRLDITNDLTVYKYKMNDSPTIYYYKDEYYMDEDSFESNKYRFSTVDKFHDYIFDGRINTCKGTTVLVNGNVITLNSYDNPLKIKELVEVLDYYVAAFGYVGRFSGSPRPMYVILSKTKSIADKLYDDTLNRLINEIESPVEDWISHLNKIYPNW